MKLEKLVAKLLLNEMLYNNEKKWSENYPLHIIFEYIHKDKYQSPQYIILNELIENDIRIEKEIDEKVKKLYSLFLEYNNLRKDISRHVTDMYNAILIEQIGTRSRVVNCGALLFRKYFLINEIKLDKTDFILKDTSFKVKKDQINEVSKVFSETFNNDNIIKNLRSTYLNIQSDIELLIEYLKKYTKFKGE